MGMYLKRCIVAFTAIGLVLATVGTGALAQSPPQGEEVKAGMMVVDALLVRPLGLAALVAGTAFFILSLPFSVLGWNVKESAEEMVVKLAKFTFFRPLGSF